MCCLCIVVDIKVFVKDFFKVKGEKKTDDPQIVDRFNKQSRAGWLNDMWLCSNQIEQPSNEYITSRLLVWPPSKCG